MIAGDDTAGGGLTETDEDKAINLTGVDLTSKDPVKRLGFYENDGTNTVDLLTSGGLTETKDDLAIDLTVVDLTSKAPADPVKRLGFYD